MSSLLGSPRDLTKQSSSSHRARFFFFSVYFICFAFIHFDMCLTVSTLFYSLFFAFMGLQLLRMQFFCYHLKWFLCVAVAAFIIICLESVFFLSHLCVCFVCCQRYISIFMLLSCCAGAHAFASAPMNGSSMLNHMSTEPIQCTNTMIALILYGVLVASGANAMAQRKHNERATEMRTKYETNLYA